MTLVREVADALRMITDVVKNTRTLVEAVNDGKKYLAAKHHGASGEFAQLLRQMEVTVSGLAEVTKVMSGFRFTSSGAAADFEPARFNRYVMDEQGEIARLKGNIRQLKADCEQIRAIRDSLNARSRSKSWTSMFGLLGIKGRNQAANLANTLSNFYADDQRMIEVIQTMLKLSQRALREVDAALGPPGTAHVQQVDTARAVLGVYAGVFKQPQEDLENLAETLTDTANSLT
jgi:hypothetical protein